MPNKIEFEYGGEVERFEGLTGRMVFRFIDGADRMSRFIFTRNEILSLVNLLLSTPTDDVVNPNNCPQCNSPIDTEKSVTIVISESGPKIIACHECTVTNAKYTEFWRSQPRDRVSAYPKEMVDDPTPEVWFRYRQPEQTRLMRGCQIESCPENARWRSTLDRYMCHSHVPTDGLYATTNFP